MKKLFLLLIPIFLFSLTIAGISQEAHNLFEAGTGSISQNLVSGVRIYAKENVSIYNISFASSMTGNIVKVLNETGGVGGIPDKILNESSITNKASQINVSLTAGQYYTISVTNDGGSWTETDFGDIGTTTPTTILPIIGRDINWVNGSRLNVTTFAFRNVETIYLRSPFYNLNGTIYNGTSYETSTESFISNITSDSNIDSATLYHNGENYSATINSLGGNVYRLSRSVPIPLLRINNYFVGSLAYWNITFANGTNTLTDSVNQKVDYINFTICGASPQNLVYYNITFKNETSAQERINASIVSSTWNYWLGDGALSKSLSYVNSNENKEYDFCFSPKDRSVNVNLSLSYDNAESEQRTFTPSALSLLNTSTSKTLFLLPSTQGQYVTFQVINTAQQALSGVEVTASRSGIGTIETGSTDSSGTVTFFLNPNFGYSFVFSKTGFDDFETTITPSQTSYTITMGGTSGSTNSTNSATGMSFVILPSSRTLSNGTTYNFNLTLNSSYWSLSSWGYTLQNKSGYVLASQSSTSASGGFLSSNLNTGENSTIVMNYFWVINGVYNNATVTWGVIDLSGNGLSIFQFFSDLATYVSIGFFGLDDVGLGIITFFAIFLITGVMSYKYGINSPAAIMALIFSLTMFFDIGLGLVPNPIGAIPHAPTFLMGIIFVAMIFREMGR